MSISVFLSYPKPHLRAQEKFIADAKAYLSRQGLEPLTMGSSNYDMDAPLAGIRRLMVGCCGLLTVAFRRSKAPNLEVRSGADIDGTASQVVGEIWLTSPYCQIEPAMAYQLGIPILVMKEQGVLEEGILEKGVTGQYLPKFDCNESVFGTGEWENILLQWIGRVRAVYDNRGRPPTLY